LSASTRPSTQTEFDSCTATELVKDASPGYIDDLKVYHGNIPHDGRPLVRIKGVVREGTKDGVVNYFAPSPPERRACATASGLPFADAQQAFDGSPNKGSVRTNGDNAFQLEIQKPNAYYAGLGTRFVPPSVHLWFVDTRGKKRHVVVKSGQGVPFRSLTYPSLPTRPRKDATFYTASPTVARSQEQILRDSAYPTETMRMPSNFWGLRPPV